MEFDQAESTKRLYYTTYDPEQPALHLKHWDHIPGILNHIGNEERSEAERRIEVRTEQTKWPEEALHGQERDIRLSRNFRAPKTIFTSITYQNMECPEPSTVSCKISHKVDDQVIYEYSWCGERDICQGIRNDDGSWTVQTVACLMLKRPMRDSSVYLKSCSTYLLPKNWTTQHLCRHLWTKLCQLWMAICKWKNNTSPKVSKQIVSMAAKITEPLVKAPPASGWRSKYAPPITNAKTYTK